MPIPVIISIQHVTCNHCYIDPPTQLNTQLQTLIPLLDTYLMLKITPIYDTSFLSFRVAVDPGVV